MTISSDSDVDFVVENLRGMLSEWIVFFFVFFFLGSGRRTNWDVEKSGADEHSVEPGGYLQWVERDWFSKFPKTASAEDAANVQLGAFLNGVMPNRE